MTTNRYDITINAPIDTVWRALTTSDGTKAWMKDVLVETDWQEGSGIVYTCYGEDGKVMQWEGKEMIWKGTIATLNPPAESIGASIGESTGEFTCMYPGAVTGLEKETYMLESVDDGTTKVCFTQDCNSQQVADSYREGSQEILDMLKAYLEK